MTLIENTSFLNMGLTLTDLSYTVEEKDLACMMTIGHVKESMLGGSVRICVELLDHKEELLCREESFIERDAFTGRDTAELYFTNQDLSIVHVIKIYAKERTAGTYQKKQIFDSFEKGKELEAHTCVDQESFEVPGASFKDMHVSCEKNALRVSVTAQSDALLAEGERQIALAVYVAAYDSDGDEIISDYERLVISMESGEGECEVVLKDLNLEKETASLKIYAQGM